MKQFLCSVVFCFVSLLSFAQDAELSYKLIHTEAIEARSVYSDRIGNLYVVDEDDALIKFNSKGKELFRFNEITLGHLAYVDAKNPYLILLYYPDYATVITLDQTLSQTSSYNLFDLNIYSDALVCLSNDQQLWLYDEVDFRLKKLNNNQEVLLESELLSFYTDQELSPNFLIERDGWLYLNFPAFGIMVFDNFGHYAKTISILDLESFQIIDQHLVYYFEGKLMAYHLLSFSEKEIQLPELISAPNQLRLEKDRLFIFSDELLYFYRY